MLALPFCDRIPSVSPGWRDRGRQHFETSGEMLDSIPAPFQAILFPLAGAAIILILGHFLPGWIRRLLAVAAVLASLAALWSLRTGDVERLEIFWEPLNLFRMGPTLYPDGLSLLGGITLAGVTVATVLGIQDPKPQRATWRALILITLAGCLIMTMAANLLTLALGSALIDLVLIALPLLVTVDDADHSNGTPLSVAVPGIVSTLVLFLSALRMDAQVGHASLLARNLPEEILTLVGIAGLLRLLIFPLHPRGWNTPQSAATLLLPVGVGIYVLARVQALAPVLANQPWILFVGGAALLAGGLLAWSGSRSSTGRESPFEFSEFWLGTLAHQTGYALVFMILLGGATPWPLLGLTLPLGALVIWWDSSLEKEVTPRPRWLEWMMQRAGTWWAKAWSYVAARFLVLERWRDSRWSQHGTALLAALALVSLAGAPATIGARGRWPFYATLLGGEDLSLLLVLAADMFLAAGLWTALGFTLGGVGEQRPKPATLLAMIAVLFPVVALGISPDSLSDGLGLQPIGRADISVWGLGLMFVLPWLLGAWLARMGVHLKTCLALVQRIVNLNWLYRAVAWVGQRLVSAIYWLGRVGEGAGWWGWALIILALGAVFVTAR